MGSESGLDDGMIYYAIVRVLPLCFIHEHSLISQDVCGFVTALMVSDDMFDPLTLDMTELSTIHIHNTLPWNFLFFHK